MSNQAEFFLEYVEGHAWPYRFFIKGLFGTSELWDQARDWCYVEMGRRTEAKKWQCTSHSFAFKHEEDAFKFKMFFC